jgi:hypothetical protein
MLTKLNTNVLVSCATIVGMEFHEWLSQQLQIQGYSPPAFATKAHISKQAIYNYLDGRIPDRASLKKIAVALRMTPEEVFTISITGKKQTEDPWVDETSQKLSILDDQRRSIASKILDALIDQQEKEQGTMTENNSIEA